MVDVALEAYLQALPEGIQKSVDAALAKSLARTIDNDKTSATAKAALAKTLVEVLDRLRALAPGEKQEDELDAIRQRLAGRSAA